MEEVLPPWFECVIDEFPSWAILMILPPLIIGITTSWKVFKFKSVGKAGLKVAACNANEQKSSGDERLQTDDLFLNDVANEEAKINTGESKPLSTLDPPNSFGSGDGNKKLGLLDLNLFDKKFGSEEEKIQDPINKNDVLLKDYKTMSADSTSQSKNEGDNNKKKSEASPSIEPQESWVEDGMVKETESTSSIETKKMEEGKPIGFMNTTNFFKNWEADTIKKTDLKESSDKIKNTDLKESSDKLKNADAKESSEKLKNIDSKTSSDKPKNIDTKESFKTDTVDMGKKKSNSQQLNPVKTPVSSYSKTSDDANDKGVSSVSIPEPEKGVKHSKDNDFPAKPTIPDSSPNLDGMAQGRKLNIGRFDPSPENKPSSSESYFLEKSDSEESSPASQNKDSPKKASGLGSSRKSADTIRPSTVGPVPEQIAPQSNNNRYDFNTMESIINAKNSEKYGDKFHLSKLNEAKILGKPFPVDAIDPLSIPGYTPSLSEKPILPKDFIKFTEPATITSYDLVPGPSLLKTVGNIWKYIPLLGTQFVSTIIYAMQSFISSYDRKLKYPNIYPYYYLLNKYGPMVRLHGPVGADILIMAVNGQDFPLVHIKNRGNKRQSLFDSLNVYRRDATPLSYMLNYPKVSKRIPDNPTLQIEQHYASLQRITDDFIMRKKFVRSYTGEKEDDGHGDDLFKWAMQCTMDVYFKTKRDYLEPETEANIAVENLIKISKSLRLCETGIQLWRAFTTLTWMDLTENCRYLDRFIVDEVTQCMASTSQGNPSGSVVELLLATEELKTTDLLTPLLDLLVINVNMAATIAGFLLYNLSTTPQVQRTLFREVSTIMPKGKGNIELADLASLKYLNACITETLRVVPLFPVLSRQLEEDTKIHSFQIPKGTFIQMVNVLPCARGDVSYDDIGRFQAERWTDRKSILGGDPFLGLPQWQFSPKFNRDLIATQVALLIAKVVREYRIDYPTSEVFADGMVLQGPTAPFKFAFIERVI